MKIRLLRTYTWRERIAALAKPLKPGDYIVGLDIPEDAAYGAIAAGVAVRIPKKGERETKAVA